MENSWVIYKHTSPSGKVYIGITTNVKSRWSGKGYHYSRYNSIFKKAIEKYGWDNIKHEVLATNLGHNTACNMEKDLIAFYKADNMSYNITDGGEGTLGRKASEETKRKSSEHNKGKHPYNLKAIEASRVAMAKMSQEEKKLKYGTKGMLGKKHSEETRRRMSAVAKGRDMSKAKAASMLVEHHYYSRHIIQCDLNNNIINEYSSITEAKRKLNKTSNSIENCLSGRAETAFGYKWIYKE